jgi:hypothetical protein
MIPRQLVKDQNVRDAESAAVLCKYMPFTPGFCSLVEHKSLYLRSLTRFKDSDPLEGVPALVEREATRGSELLKWYDDGKALTYVNCFILADIEYDYMWNQYAGGDSENGLMLKTTVGRLEAELSRPAPARGSGEYPCDGFIVGIVEYFDDADIGLYPEMSIQPSSARPVFRKRRVAFEKEKEFRVMLTPGSKSSNDAYDDRRMHCLIPVDLLNLISEIRLKPGSSRSFRDHVCALLRHNGLGSIPLFPLEI